MLSFDATQLAIVAAANKDDISWLFQIDRTGNDVINDYWSTKAKTWDGHDYTFKVIDFSATEMHRAQSESGIQAPSEFTFTITNKDNTLTTADFSSARINLLLVVKAGANEAQIRSWSFRITEVDPGYQKLTFHCIDWLQAFLEGDYPKDAVIESLFIRQAQIVDISQLAGSIAPPGVSTPGSYEEIYAVSRLCAPLVFGRPTIPIIPIYFPSPEYFGYLLGRSTGTPADYDVYKIKTPSDYTGNPLEFSKDDYTFSYTDKVGQDGNNYTFGLFECLDSDGDGLPDISMAIAKGNTHMPLNAEYERDDLKDKTAPADVLEYILEDWGIPSAKIDATTQAAANTTYAGWGLTWNVGLFNKETRKRLLARLLQMCHTELIVRDKIYFKVHAKTSQKTLTKADIIKENERGEGTFKYELIEKRDEKDSGYVTYQVAGECLDHLVKALVTVKGTYDNIASDVVSADYVQDSQAAQKLGMLALQRKFLPLAKVTFTLKSTCLALECDDIITPNHADYGGTYAVLIDSMTINRDLSIAIEATRFSQALDDWGDLAPSALTVVDDQETDHLEVVTSGPDAQDSAGNQIGNVLKGRLRIGETGNYILFDPVEPIQTFVEGGVTRMRIGDLGTDDWGIEFLDHAGTSIFRLDGSGVNTLSGWAVDGNKFTCQSGQVGMNAEETGGVDWRFWAGHATPGSAPFRVDESGNLYCTLIYATGGTIGGWTIGATKLSITGIELDAAENRIRVFTGDNYVDMTAAGLTGYDSVLGTTFKLPTNGDAPEFSSGIIKECVYEIYTSGVIRTNADPSANGGLIINNTDLKGYTSAGLKVLQFIYDGTDQGDAYIGDYDNTNPGLKYDHSAGLFNFRGTIAIESMYALPSDEKLEAYFAFDEGAGTVAVDGSGNGNGTIVGSPTVIDGMVGQALNFNGANKVTLDTPVGTAATWTVSLWYKRTGDGASDYRSLIADKTANIHHLLILSPGTTTLSVWDGSGHNFSYSIPDDGKFHHYVVIYISGSTADLYVDGVWNSQVSHSIDLSVNKFGSIGNWYSNSYYAGPIDEVRIYSYALTASEIKSLYLYPAGSKGVKISGGQITANTIVASAINGAGFGTLTITSGKIAINTADALEIQAGGNIKVLAGGDIHLYPSAVSESDITWHGTSYNVSISMDYANNKLCLFPSTDSQGVFYIGMDASGEKKFYSMIFYAGDSFKLSRRTSATDFDHVLMDSDGLTLQAQSDNVTQAKILLHSATGLMTLEADGGYIKPSDNKGTDFGQADFAWDDAYADDWHNVADFFCLDEYDDLQAILDIKPSKIVDKRTGLTLIDDNSLPEWMLSRYKKSGVEKDNARKIIRRWKKGDIMRDPEGKPYVSLKMIFSSFIGTIKRLNQKIEDLS